MPSKYNFFSVTKHMIKFKTIRRKIWKKAITARWLNALVILKAPLGGVYYIWCLYQGSLLGDIIGDVYYRGVCQGAVYYRGVYYMGIDYRGVFYRGCLLIGD